MILNDECCYRNVIKLDDRNAAIRISNVIRKMNPWNSFFLFGEFLSIAKLCSAQIRKKKRFFKTDFYNIKLEKFLK